MKFTTAIVSLFATSAIASPLHFREAASDYETTYQIKDLTLRKYDGVTINSMFFNITATNAGTLNFECVPYDSATGGATDNFDSSMVYSCGNNTFFSFNYTPAHDQQTNELFLWQDVSDTVTIGGSGFIDDPICRAGGATVDDLVCSVPDSVYFAITLDKLA